MMDARHYFASELTLFPRRRVGAALDSGAIALSTVGQVAPLARLVDSKIDAGVGILIEAIGLDLFANGGTSVSQLFQFNGARFRLIDGGNVTIMPLGEVTPGSATAVGGVSFLLKPNLLLSFVDATALEAAVGSGPLNNTGPFGIQLNISFLNTDAAGTLNLSSRLYVLYRLVNGFHGGD